MDAAASETGGEQRCEHERGVRGELQICAYARIVSTATPSQSTALIGSARRRVALVAPPSPHPLPRAGEGLWEGELGGEAERGAGLLRRGRAAAVAAAGLGGQTHQLGIARRQAF